MKIHVDHGDLYDQKVVQDLLRARVQAVAEGFGFEVGRLRIGDQHDHELLTARRLAIALCSRVTGSNLAWIAKWFGVDRINYHSAMFIHQFEDDPAVREQAAKICQSLGVAVPGSAEELIFPSERVELVLREVSARSGLEPADLCRARLSPRLTPWRTLALDICVRMTEVNGRELARVTGLSYPLVRVSRMGLVGELIADPALRAADREICALVGVPPRRESRERETR